MLSSSTHQTVLRTVEKSATEVIGMDPVTVKARSTAQLLLGKIPGGGGVHSLIWAIEVCGATKGLVFQPFWS